MNKLALLIAVAATGLMLFIATPVFAEPSLLAATSQEESCKALESISPDGGSCGTSTGRSVSEIMKLVINLISVVAGIIAVIMLIVSGLKYITSQGDSNQVSSSKQSLIYAIVGLVIVALAQFIVRFVLTKSINA